MADVKVRLPEEMIAGGHDVIIQNAAQESTLERLVQIFDKKFGAGDRGATIRAQREKAQLDATENLSERIDRFGEKLGRGMLEFGSLVIDQNSQLKQFGNIAVYVGDELGIVGKILTNGFRLLAIELDTQIDAFRDMSGVGLQFTAGLIDSRKGHTEARISLEQFKNVVTGSATELALMGGSVKIGTQRFININKIVQDSAGNAFANLGMTLSEMTEIGQDYIELQTRTGRAQMLTDAEMARGQEDYIRQIDLLSTVTGKHRKQISDALKQDMEQTKFKAMFAQAEKTGNEEIRKSFALFGSTIKDPAMLEALKRMIMTGGIPGQDAASRSLLLFGDNIQAAFKAVRDGVPGASQMLTEELQKMGEATNNMSAEQIKNFTLLANMGFDIVSAGIAFQDMTKLADGMAEAEAAQKKMVDENTNALNTLHKSFQNLQNHLIRLLLPTIEYLTKGMNWIATKLAAISAPDGALGAFSIAGGTAVTAIAGLAVAFGALKLVIFTLTKTFGLLGGALKMLLGGMGATKALGAGKGMGKGMMMGGVYAGVGLGALGLGAGIGIGAIGAGLMVAGKGMTMFGEGLERVAGVDGQALKSVAGGTMALVGAMTALNLGGAVTSVAGVFTKIFGGGTDNFAKNMNKMLNDLDEDKLTRYAMLFEKLNDNYQKLGNTLTVSGSAVGKNTGDKLDTLNTTMIEVKNVLEQSDTKQAKMLKADKSNMFQTV